MLHDQAAAFALDALGGEEANEFERHLAVCPRCEDEVAGLQLAAVAMAFALELPVPRPALRRRVLDTGAPVIRLWGERRLVVAAAVLAACAATAIVMRPWVGSATTAGMHRYTAKGARATLLVGGSGEAVLMAGHLPPVPAGKVYEVWVLDGGKALPAGFLRRNLVTLTRPVPPGASVAVSVEPAPGSAQPTGSLLLRAETT